MTDVVINKILKIIYPVLRKRVSYDKFHCFLPVIKEGWIKKSFSCFTTRQNSFRTNFWQLDNFISNHNNAKESLKGKGAYSEK